MRNPGINGEGELRGQLANPGSPGKMAVKMEYVCVYVYTNCLGLNMKQMRDSITQCSKEGIGHKKSLISQSNTIPDDTRITLALF